MVESPIEAALVVLGPVVVFVLGAAAGLLYLGIDRKLVAHMQGRIGPPIIQPFRDVEKLLMKESIVPDGSIPWLFRAAPMFCLIASGALLLYIPLFGQAALLGGYGDAIVVLYLLTAPSLAMVVGGFASGSPYATVGGQREMVVMMSYEFPLALTIVALGWRIGQVTDANPFMLSTMASFPIWNLVGPVGFLGAAILLLVLLVVTPAELSKVPFDIPEAETEIAGGLLVEYSGRNLALYYVATAVRTLAIAALVVALFFPYRLSGLVGVEASVPMAALDAVWFVIKVFAVLFVCVMVVRSTMARFKIDQATRIYFIWVTLIGLFGLLLVWIDLLL
ncbi:MAG: respiratory chain complex I subunit 1 family protein [Chloroflexota bacterium]